MAAPDTERRGKRVVTTDGRRLGWATRGADDALYVVAEPGLLRGCDSWIAPSWNERDRFRLDDRAVVGVGEATVVLDVDGDRTGNGRSAPQNGSDEPDDGRSDTRIDGEESEPGRLR